MKRFHLLLIAASLGMLLSGCVVRAHGHARVGYVAPELVYVSPGVQVVADYHEPVFYSEGFYWRYYGGVWYRSSYHSYGWVRVHAAPTYVVRIGHHNHHRYVRYRGNANSRARYDHYRNPPPARGPVVRDHRRPAVRHAPPPARGPVVRDHRGGGNTTVKVKAKPAKPKAVIRDHRN
jgi:hypothetical protein